MKLVIIHFILFLKEKISKLPTINYYILMRYDILVPIVCGKKNNDYLSGNKDKTLQLNTCVNNDENMSEHDLIKVNYLPPIIFIYFLNLILSGQQFE